MYLFVPFFARRSSSTKLFDVVVAGSQDMAVSVRCYQQLDGNLLAQFTALKRSTSRK